MSPRTALHLLGFISNGSPLRYPHVAKPTFLGSYFSSMSNPIPPASSRHSNFALQPSRRDIILCLLTLSFSYLLFSPPPTSEPLGLRNRSQASSGGYRIPGWSKIFTTELGCPPVPSSGETTFGESVKMIGPQVAMGVEGDEFRRTSNGRPWEEGEEEAEDDELGSVFTVLAGHQPGWTMMERLYVFNGSFYVVT